MQHQILRVNIKEITKEKLGDFNYPAYSFQKWNKNFYNFFLGRHHVLQSSRHYS